MVLEMGGMFGDAIAGAFEGGLTSLEKITITDLGIPDVSILGKQPSPFIRPLSKGVEYLGELFLQQCE